MDTGALFIGFCLAFCAGAVLAMVVAAFEIRKLKLSNDYLDRAVKREVADGARWQSAYFTRNAQLRATRIALREAQKNDHRDARGRFVKG